MDPTLFAILVVLGDRAATAPALLERLEALDARPDVPVATFYRRLRAALDNGWIVAHDEPPAGPGRPGKLYGISPEGRAVARLEASRLQQLSGIALRRVGKSEGA